MTSKPPDALFKAAFEYPEHAAALFRAILPAAIADTFAWATMTHVPQQLTNEALEARAMPAFPKLALWLLRDARHGRRLLDNLPFWARHFVEARRAPQGPESVRVLINYIPWDYQARLATASVDALDLWAERVLSAASIDEVFAASPVT